MLYSKLFIACPALSSGNYQWLGDIDGTNPTGDEKELVHVIALNCENKDEIEAFLEKTIKETEALEVKTQELEQELVSLRDYLNEIRCKVFEHQPPVVLIEEAISKIREDCGNELANQLTSEKFMYLSK